MSLSHVVVWVDYQEAHVIQFNAGASETEIIKTKSKHHHSHQKTGSSGDGKISTDQDYSHEVVLAVSEANEILIVGPGSAKLELLKHANKHDAKVSEKIIGVETVDHPSDGQLMQKITS